MNLNSYYLHAIDCQNEKPFDGKHSLEVLREILVSGELKSKRLRGITDKTYGGWNGIDYISLCDYRRKNNKPYDNDKYLKDYTAYETYIKRSISFILKKNKIKAIKPQLVAPIIFDWNSHYMMYELGNSTEGRYSDLLDEVQVKDRISFDRVKGMTIPIEYMLSEHTPVFMTKDFKYIEPYTIPGIINFLKQVRELLKLYGVSSELYDLETQMQLKNDDDVVKVVEEIRRRKTII